MERCCELLSQIVKAPVWYYGFVPVNEQRDYVSTVYGAFEMRHYLGARHAVCCIDSNAKIQSWIDSFEQVHCRLQGASYKQLRRKIRKLMLHLRSLFKHNVQ